MLLGPQLREVDNHLRSLLHSVERAVLELTVEVHTASEDIGAGEAHKRQTSTVRSTTYRLDDRLHVGLAHSLYGLVNHVGVWLNHLAHIVVLVLERELQHALAILLLQQIYARPDEDLLLLELLAVVVANDI